MEEVLHMVLEDQGDRDKDLAGLVVPSDRTFCRVFF